MRVRARKEGTNFQRILPRLIFISFTLLIVCTFAIFFLSFTSKGIDFTDEGFNLQSIYYPRTFSSSDSQFGFLYYIFTNFTGKNLAILRILNVALTLSLGFIFTSLILRYSHNLSSSKTLKFILKFVASFFTLTIFSLGVFTPSYNSLNFQLLLVLASLIQLFVYGPSKFKLLIVGALGICCTMDILTKLSSGILVTIISLGLIILQKEKTFSKISCFILSGILTGFFLAYTISGNIVQFFHRYDEGLKVSRFLGHSLKDIFKLYIFYPNRNDIKFLFLLFLTLFAVAFSTSKRAIYLTFIFLFFCILYFRILGKNAFNAGTFRNIWLAFILVPLLYANYRKRNWSFAQMKNKLATIEIFWLLVLFVFPLIFAVGTNNSYWEIGSWVSIFSFFAFYKFIDSGLHMPIPEELILCTFILSFFLIVYSTVSGLYHPYRQVSLFKANASIVFQNQKLPLYVGDQQYRAILDFRELVKKSGDRSFTNRPTLDLTGDSPGLIFAGAGRTLGSPWIAGGYKNADLAMITVLKDSQCVDLAYSNILYEPLGLRSISSSVLNNFGIDFPKNYQLLGEIDLPIDTEGNLNHRKLQLFKPLSLNLKPLKNCKR